MPTHYLFESARLGFRLWQPRDLDTLAAINAAPIAMEFFPYCYTRAQTADFIDRMMTQWNDCGFTYFAIDELNRNECIGFIGLCEQDYPSPFTPCVDIGWRLTPSVWNRGLASEGAKRCLEWAFNERRLHQVVAVTPQINLRSQAVMKKIGMRYQFNFQHPALLDNERLRDCVMYQADNPGHSNNDDTFSP